MNKRNILIILSISLLIPVILALLFTLSSVFLSAEVDGEREAIEESLEEKDDPEDDPKDDPKEDSEPEMTDEEKEMLKEEQALINEQVEKGNSNPDKFYKKGDTITYDNLNVTLTDVDKVMPVKEDGLSGNEHYRKLGFNFENTSDEKQTIRTEHFVILAGGYVGANIGESPKSADEKQLNDLVVQPGEVKRGVVYFDVPNKTDAYVIYKSSTDENEPAYIFEIGN